jgi:hypothetical protein
MGGTCSTYVVEERWIQGFGGKTRGKENWKAIIVDGRIISKWISKKLDARACTGSVWLKLGATGRLM